MAKEDEGCPSCGSQWAERISGPDERSADVDGLDTEQSGTFVCQSCDAEYYVEVGREAGVDLLPKFSPTARCTRCSSYSTKIRATNPAKNQRSHQCDACFHIFVTERSDK